MLVLVLTVFVNVITAVALGMIMASLLFVKRMADLQLDSIQTVSTDSELLTPEEQEAFSCCHGRALILRLSGPLSFGAASGMLRRLGLRLKKSR